MFADVTIKMSGQFSNYYIEYIERKRKQQTGRDECRLTFPSESIHIMIWALIQLFRKKSKHLKYFNNLFLDFSDQRRRYVDVHLLQQVGRDGEEEILHPMLADIGNTFAILAVEAVLLGQIDDLLLEFAFHGQSFRGWLHV